MSNAQGQKAWKAIQAFLDREQKKELRAAPTHLGKAWRDEPGAVCQFVEQLVVAKGMERWEMIQLIPRGPDPRPVKSVLGLLIQRMSNAENLRILPNLTALVTALGRKILPLLHEDWRPPANEQRDLCLIAAVGVLADGLGRNDLALALGLMERVIGWFDLEDAKARRSAGIVRTMILKLIDGARPVPNQE